ncbi:hypothetical protein OG474_37840 [Kribbella sp. NBC_01505]|uniref:hypothetical protein n=1 Tax=Kribbella sp. NBC_01505 TaxID=2903580 RepID=UPI00386FF239
MRIALFAVLIALVLPGCSVARNANRVDPSIPAPPPGIPTVIAPPQAQGLDGRSGAPGPQVCTAIAGELTGRLSVPVVAHAGAWNDGGLPALDLCTLLVEGRSVTVGVSALPRQPDSLGRLLTGAGHIAPLTELGPEAQITESRIVFITADHAIRITPAGGIDQGRADGLDRAKAVTIALAARDAVPRVLRTARQTDSTCQISNSAAEKFIGAAAQLRRDYRVHGALTCIWGTPTATVAIVEAFDQTAIPESQRTPPPHNAPIGSPGYYLPENAELVFQLGRRVVRVTALTTPPRAVPLEALTDIVDQMMPLFLR